MSDFPERSGERRDDFTERRPKRRADDEEAEMRRRYARDKEDANRQSIGNVRGEVTLIRQELRADLEKVSDASRERDKELHQKFDSRSEKFDERLDKLKDDVTTLRSEVATFNKIMEKKEKGEFDDAPFYARPSYIKAMGLAIAAIIAAVVTSLGLVFGWGGGTAPPVDPHAAEAPAHPGEGD
jgi:hypothetical protein